MQAEAQQHQAIELGGLFDLQVTGTLYIPPNATRIGLRHYLYYGGEISENIQPKGAVLRGAEAQPDGQGQSLAGF